MNPSSAAPHTASEFNIIVDNGSATSGSRRSSLDSTTPSITDTGRPPVTHEGLNASPGRFKSLFTGRTRSDTSRPDAGSGTQGAFTSAAKNLKFFRSSPERALSKRKVHAVYCNAVPALLGKPVEKTKILAAVKDLTNVTADDLKKTIKTLSPQSQVDCDSLSLGPALFEKVARARRAVIVIHTEPPQTLIYRKQKDGSWKKADAVKPRWKKGAESPVGFLKKAAQQHVASPVEVVTIKPSQVERPLSTVSSHSSTEFETVNETRQTRRPPSTVENPSLQDLVNNADRLFDSHKYSDAIDAYIKALAEYQNSSDAINPGGDKKMALHLYDRIAAAQTRCGKVDDLKNTWEAKIRFFERHAADELNLPQKKQHLLTVRDTCKKLSETYFQAKAMEKAAVYLEKQQKAMEDMEDNSTSTREYAEVLSKQSKALQSPAAIESSNAAHARQEKIKSLENKAVEVIVNLANRVPADNEYKRPLLGGTYLKEYEYYEAAIPYFQRGLEKLPPDKLQQRYDALRALYDCQKAARKYDEMVATETKIREMLENLSFNNDNDAWLHLQTLRTRAAKRLLDQNPPKNEDAMAHLQKAKAAFKATERVLPADGTYLAVLDQLSRAMFYSAESPEQQEASKVIEKTVEGYKDNLKDEQLRLFKELTGQEDE